MPTSLIPVSFALLAAPAAAQCQEWSGDFVVPGIAGSVHAQAVWDDGNGPALFVAGQFQAAGPIAARNIVRWDGSVTIFSGYGPGFVNYCTAGTSSSGCQASIAGSGVPSATQTGGFTLSASSVEGEVKGLFFFSVNGRQANAWGNGTSFQCAAPPVRRASIQSAGAKVQAQLWYRDSFNTSNQTTSLSDALEFMVLP